MPTRHQERTRLSRVRNTALLVLPAGVAALLAAAWSPVTASGQAVAGEWRFDEPDGQVARDTGPNGLHGQLGTGAEPDASDPARIAGLSGGAVRFAGDASVRVPDTSELGPARLTLETVARSDGSPGPYRYIVSRGGQACFAGAYGLYTGEHGGLALYVLDGSRYVVSAAARPADIWDGRWHHIAGTYDGQTVRLFVDGRQVGNGTPAAGAIDYDLPTPDMAVGSYQGSCSMYLIGDVDGVSIWDRALPISQIGDLVRSLLGGR
jgi:Concanavalin A-like lectin/glucanases superfamily